MKKIILFLISPILLGISILFSNLSRNDKVPVFIFFAFGIIALIFVVSLILNLSKGFTSPNLKSLFLGVTLTLTYVIAVIFLSRAGLVDSNIFLGFR